MTTAATVSTADSLADAAGETTSPLTLLGRRTRLALRLYPERWRRDYETEMAWVLVEVAEAEGRQSPRAAQIADLAMRGAWRRARVSPLFWVSVAAAAAFVVFTSMSFGGFRTAASWTAYLGLAGAGLTYVLPLVAGAAAWTARRRSRHRASSAQPRMRAVTDALTDTALAAAALGLAAVPTLATLVAVSGWPLPSSLDPLLPLGFLGMTATAVALGRAAGSLLPLGPAVLLPVVLEFLWLLPTIGGGRGVWMRNLTGDTLVGCCQDFAWAPAPRTVLVVAVTGTILLGASVLIALPTRRIPRWFAGAALVTVLVGATSVVLPALQPFVGDDWTATRAPDALVCRGTAPRICLWPEQEDAQGETARATLTLGWNAAREAGGSPPALITTAADLDSTPGDAHSTHVGWSGGADRDDITRGYAQAIVMSTRCGAVPAGQDAESTSDEAAAYGLALAMGMPDDDDDLPQIATPGIEAQKPAPLLSPAATRDALGIHSRQEARTYLASWFAAQKTCAG